MTREHESEGIGYEFLHNVPEEMLGSGRFFGQLQTLWGELHGNAVLTESGFRRALAAHPQTWVRLALSGDGSPVGMGTLRILPARLKGAKEGFIDDVVVFPTYRRRGIARAICHQLVCMGREFGCKRVELTSRNEHAEAHALYDSLGFRQRDTTVFRLDL